MAGTASAQIDISEKLGHVLPIYLAVVLALSLLIPIVVFRSILVPVVATMGFSASAGRWSPRPRSPWWPSSPCGCS